ARTRASGAERCGQELRAIRRTRGDRDQPRRSDSLDAVAEPSEVVRGAPPDVHPEALARPLRLERGELVRVPADQHDPGPGRRNLGGVPAGPGGEPRQFAGSSHERVGSEPPRVPPVRRPRGDADRGIFGPTDPHRRGTRRQERARERRDPPPALPRPPGEERAERQHGLLEQGEAFGEWRVVEPERRVLGAPVRIAHPEPQHGAAPADLVERRRLLRQHSHRTEPRPRDEHPDAEAGVRGPDRRQQRVGLERGSVRRSRWEEVIRREDGVEACGRGAGCGLHGFRGVGREDGQHEAKLHPRSSNASSAAPIAALSVPRYASTIGTAGRYSAASTASTNAARAGSRRRSPAPPTPPPTTTVAGSSTLTNPAIPSPRRRPTSVTMPRATASPSRAASTTMCPVTASGSPPARAASGACRRAAARPSRAMPEPPATAPPHPRLPHPQTGPSGSTTIWPTSAANPWAPR